MTARVRIIIVSVFAVLAALSVYFLFHLKFSFDFEQFFPEGDEDLEFFQDFIESFETDDNFLLIAVRRDSGVFEQQFLKDFHDLTVKSRALPHVEATQSLTKFEYPIKTPFAITSVPAIHINQPARYAADRERILNDERFVHNLINKDATAMVIFVKVVERIQLDQARELMAALNELVDTYEFENYHYLGRPYFQKELVAMQQREVTVSAIISGILVTFIMFFIFRRPLGILVALTSIGLGMLLFMGLLGALGRELNAMAALYPVLMIIVGTSDVIHIMSKYVDELRKGLNRRDAIRITVKEIGMATFLTSLTTSIGFASLLSSRVGPIRDFGINAALGVIVAYVTVIFFTSALLTWLRTDQIIKLGKSQAFWEKSMVWSYNFTVRNPRRIALTAVAFLLLSFWGISMINTNYNIINNMPRGRQITEDFHYFERELTGFRPLEFAVYTQPGYDARSFEVLSEMAKIEEHLKQYPSIQAVTSATTLYKSINQMYNNNRQDAYEMPDSEARFASYQKLADRVPDMGMNVLISEDGSKARITSRIQDIGADSIKYLGKRIDNYIATQVDTSIIKVKRTGTGLIIDKNAEYVRASLLYGLGMAVLIVSILMALLFRDWRMIVISLVPNLFPLILAGALLGFIGIELEAGVSIVFAVIFGIAVDDTIHFLSKYKLALNKGLSREEALRVTFTETGKAIVLTSIILFFGFLVMLFSIHPPSVTIGLLISLTLASALIADLALIPVLVRWMSGSGKE